MAASVDALGKLADAGLVAAALDRADDINAAEVADAHHDCANCGTHLTGNFCTNCGQRAHVHRSLLHVGEEFLHGITHFDGKAWTTLPMLLFRPGKLTRDYIMGKRTRYIAPVPLFLLIVFSTFFAFSFIGGEGAAAPGGDTPMTRAEAIKALPEIEANVADIDRQIAAAKASGQNGALSGMIAARAGLVVARDRIRARANDEIVNPIDLPGAIAGEIRTAGSEGEAKIDLGSESLNLKVRKAMKDPEFAFYKIQNKAYKLSFLLVPMSLPWLWLLFAWRRDVRMYDHAIFALYSISFMSLLFVAGSIAAAVGVTAGAFWFALVCAAPVAHMFVQLKGAYALSNRGAAWRTVALSFFAMVTLPLFAMLMIVIGVLD